MGNACNFAADDEEMHMGASHLQGNRGTLGGMRSESHSLHGYQTMENSSNFAPTKNPLRMVEIDQEELSDEPGLVYVQELIYSNGAVYRGQIKAVEKLRQNNTDRDILSPSESRNSYISQSINDKTDRVRHSIDQRSHVSLEKVEVPSSNSRVKPGSVSKSYLADSKQLNDNYATASNKGEGGMGIEPHLMASPSLVSQGAQTRMESIYGDEMDDGTRGVRHGYGVQVWQDGAKYKGQWQNNKAHGKGTFWHADGDYYEGEFKNDKSNGYGVFHCTDGTVYEGVWRDDIQHGQGQAHWPDGSSYMGNYYEGRRHGVGSYKWTNGNSYSGEWQDNSMNGFGTYEWADGRKYEGYWQKNFMHGSGVYTWPDGRKYDGQYESDQKNGTGTFYWPDGRKYSGGWQAGKQHGEATFTAANGESRMGIWEDGKRVGWIGDFNSATSSHVANSQEQQQQSSQGSSSAAK